MEPSSCSLSSTNTPGPFVYRRLEANRKEPTSLHPSPFRKSLSPRPTGRRAEWEFGERVDEGENTPGRWPDCSKELLTLLGNTNSWGKQGKTKQVTLQTKPSSCTHNSRHMACTHSHRSLTGPEPKPEAKLGCSLHCLGSSPDPPQAHTCSGVPSQTTSRTPGAASPNSFCGLPYALARGHPTILTATNCSPGFPAFIPLSRTQSGDSWKVRGVAFFGRACR